MRVELSISRNSSLFARYRTVSAGRPPNIFAVIILAECSKHASHQIRNQNLTALNIISMDGDWPSELDG